MAKTKRRAVVVEEEPEYLLQEILALKEPMRTHEIKQWIDAADYDVVNGGTVKIGTPDGMPMQVFVGQDKMNITPSGRRVERRLALKLLLDYGRTGTYRGYDQATGMTQDAWDSMQPEHKALFANRKFNFNENYLEQLPDGNASDEEDSEE